MRMMSWNIKTGGFNGYDQTATKPEREDAIRAVISRQHARGVTAVTLPDAYRWDEAYGDDQGIARHTGYKDARFTRLNDRRLEEIGLGPGVGIAFVTDEKIASSKVLDLGSRCGLGVVLDVGKYGLQIGNVYLDDMSEEERGKQAVALVSEMELDVPTLLVGDFNALRDSMRGSKLRHKLGDLMVRSAALLLPTGNALGESIRGMNQRQAMPMLQCHGFQDGDALGKRPTAPAIAPVFGIDYALAGPNTQISNFEVLPKSEIGGASDHLPIVFDVAAA